MRRSNPLRNSAIGAALLVLQSVAFAQASDEAQAGSGGIGGFFSNIGKSVGNLFESMPEKPLLATLTPGPYQASNEAIGEERDVESNRLDHYGLVPIKAYQDYANRIYARLKDLSGVTAIPGNVYILALTDLTAKSSPDGNVYLSMGWIKTIESEDELAALLAHELGHVLLHHHDSNLLSVAQKKLQYAFAFGSGLKNTLDQLGQSNAASMTPGQMKSLQRMQLLVAMTDTIVLPAWTRSQEISADRIGADLLRKAGYSESGMSDLLERISKWDVQQEATRQARQAAIQAEMEALMNSGGIDAALKLGLEDVGKGLKEALMSQHENGGNRIAELAAYREKHHEDWPKSIVKKPEYVKVKEDRAVKPVLDAYERTFEAIALNQAGNHEKAYAVLVPVTKKGAPIATHAVPNHEMYTAMVKMGNKEAFKQLKTSLTAADLAWNPIADAIRHQNKYVSRPAALEIVKEVRLRFKDAPALTPRFVEVFAELDFKEELQQEMTTCTASHVAYRELCFKKSKRK